MSSPCTSLRSLLRLRPVCQGAGEPGIFQVSEPGRKFEMFPTPTAYMEEEALNSSTYVEETVRRVTPRVSLRSVLRQQAVFEGGGSLKFFKVSGPI